MATRRKRSKAPSTSESRVSSVESAARGQASERLTTSAVTATEQTRRRQAKSHPFVGVWPDGRPT
eukprot:5140058-Ditylum_brightwellii.AAC.1